MKRIFGISLVLFTGLLFSCQNNKVEVPVDEQLVEKSATINLTEANLEAISNTAEYEAEFYANAEESLTRMFQWGKRWMWTSKLRYVANHCPDVAIVSGENNGYPKTITLNYGKGTVMKNDKVLSGIIEIEISGPRRSESFTRMVTYKNFEIDTVRITGTSLVEINRKTETFREYTSDLKFKISGTVIKKEIVRSSSRTWTWIEGMETLEDQTDDVIHIEGTTTASDGTDTYKKEIKDPLVRLGDCKYIVKGIVKITLNTSVSSLNYGNGECDDEAVLINAEGETIEVDLSVYKRKHDKDRNNSGKS